MTVHFLPQVEARILSGQPLMVIAIFRTLDLFRRDYDPDHLRRLSDRLARDLMPAIADSLVSDAILVDNELRLRAGGFVFFLDDTPTASLDEAALLTMLAAMQEGDRPRAWQAGIQIGILQPRMLLILAHRLACKLAQAGVSLGGPFRGTASAAPGRPKSLGRAALRVV